MRHWLLLTGLAGAQLIPDSVKFVEASSGDTTFLVAWQVTPWGWQALRYTQAAGTWRLLGQDSCWIDPQKRLREIRRYIDTATTPAPPSLAPVLRLVCDYPQPNLWSCTTYNYERSLSTWVPRRRFTLWGGPTQWDSLLSSWVGVLGLGWSRFAAESVWPFAVLHHRTLWGDSLQVESFDAGFGVFVEESGYVEMASTSSCDSLALYNAPRINPTFVGHYRLCADLSGRLLTTQDSFCTPTECLAQYRFLSWDSQGRLQEDSLHLRFYTPQGQPLGEQPFPCRYAYDAQGRLTQARFLGGTYVFFYGSQVVELAVAQQARPTLFQVGRTWYVKGTAEVPFALYDGWGRCLRAGVVGPTGEIGLPEALPPGLYHLRIGAHSWRILLLP
ncbi:MAG: hypothetical protein D6750_09655 [Bacteroidetes bacterium]|nr:MAG: hypothetical protein D6750_09655 [Bacteroidota bacterium]